MGSTVVTVAGGAKPSYTFARKPTTGIIGDPVYISDVGVNGSLWAWNGSAWVCVSGVAPVMLNGITMGIPSSGVMGNNGALSAITALPFTFSEGLYMYFPANAIAAGVAAGMYWVVMSSTTAGTVYNNTYTGGTPQAPAANTSFVTTGPGAYVQTTAADITLANVTVLGGLIGTNGTITADTVSYQNNTAGTKTLKHRFASTDILSLAATTTSLSGRFSSSLKNSNSTSIQAFMPASSVMSAQPSSGFSSSTPTRAAIATASDQTYSIIGQLSLATDYLLLASADILVYPR